jgi:hypothetical protein
LAIIVFSFAGKNLFGKPKLEKTVPSIRSIIGSDGFGFAPLEDGVVKFRK